MTKELARYFFMLIVKDLQFSFNGMGLPNNACEWLENQLIQENFDEVEEFINKRYDERITNVTLELFKEKQKAQEPEDEIKEKAKPDFLEICKNVGKKIKTRKFRAMSNSEFCITYAGEENFDCCNCSLYRQADICVLADDWNLIAQKPYKTKDGKYILIEVKE